MPTIGDAITGALQDLGVLGAGETPTGADMAVGLSRVNDWIDGLANEGLTIYTITRTTWAIVSGVGSYSVALGSSRPVRIHHVSYIDTAQSPPLERHLAVLTEDGYAVIPQKAQTAVYPSLVYYNPTFPTGTVTLLPVPTSSTLQGVIYTPTPVGTFTVAADDLALPPGYRRFVRTNLALEIAPAFGATASAELTRAARDSKATLKRTNIRLMDLSIDRGACVGASRGHYDITTGW